jgi:hypothetical protein
LKNPENLAKDSKQMFKEAQRGVGFQPAKQRRFFKEAQIFEERAQRFVVCHNASKFPHCAYAQLF